MIDPFNPERSLIFDSDDIFLLLDSDFFIKSVENVIEMKGVHKPTKFTLSLSNNTSYEILFKKGSDIRGDWIILQSLCLIKQVNLFY